MIEYFHDVYALLFAVNETAKAQLGVITDENVRGTIKAKAKLAIAARLMKEAQDAMVGHPEYSYAPLREHLLKNLENVGHIEIGDNFVVAKVFDTRIGGTAEDLESGLYTSYSSDKTRSLGWRWGVYVPAREGGSGFQWTKKSSPMLIADYNQVIQDRLSAWGDKAPYWYFLEHGNLEYTGKGIPYPVFAGTEFIAKTAQVASDILGEIIMQESADLVIGVESGFTDAVLTKKATTARIEVIEIEFGWEKETYRSSRGKVFMRYREPASGRWKSYETMLMSIR